MKAIVLTEAGSPENLVLQEVPMPQPKESEVLVKIKAISINPVDSKTRKGGALLASLQQAPPAILGWDIAGDVTAVGAGVTKFKAGDKVFGMINFPGNGKAYAEYATAPEAHLAHIPEGIGYDEAAATTLAALTAWQVLVHQAAIGAGQRVLIHAAAGGVGHFAVQIAKHFDAFVVGTASAANAAFLKGLSIDQTIDYNNEDFSQTLHDIDIVLDPIGGETTFKSVGVLKKGGTLISIVGGAKPEVESLAGDNGSTAKNYLVHSSGEDMQQLAILLKEGQLKPTISHQYSFNQIAEAHRQIETGKTRGKIIVNVG